MAAENRAFEILLAEDNVADADLVRMALKEHSVPCTLHIVCDGAEVIEFLGSLDSNSEPPPLDLLLMDMHLPKRDGQEILKYLRSTERYAQTPVVAMSGLNSPGVEEQAKKDPAIVYFRKPSGIDEYMRLGAIVQNILQKTRGAA